MAKIQKASYSIPLERLIVISFFLVFINFSGCMAAKLGSKSFENGGYLPTNFNKGSNLNSDINNTEPKEKLLGAVAAKISEDSKKSGNQSEPESQSKYSITVYPWNNHLGKKSQIKQLLISDF